MKIHLDPGDGEILRKRLGLAPDADLAAAVGRRLVAPAPGGGSTAAAGGGGGTTDPSAEGVIQAAVKAGKFSADRADHYRQRWAANPETTRKLIARLQPGVVLPALAGGPDDAYDPAWLPELQRLQAE